MIISVCILFLSVSLINICSANMLDELGHSWRGYLKKISESGGKLLYFLLASVFCYMVSFIFLSSASAIGYIFLSLSLLFAACYCYKRKAYFHLSGEAVYVFMISQMILLVICILGYFSGGAILAIMLVLSIFVSIASDSIYLKITKKKRLEKYKNSQIFSGKKTICIFNDTNTDVSFMLSAMLKEQYTSIVYEEVSPMSLLRQSSPKEEICIFSSRIYSANETAELIFLAKPDILIVIGQSQKVDRKLLELIKCCETIYSNIDEIIIGLAAKDIRGYKDLGLGLGELENSIAAMSLDVLLILGIDEHEADYALRKLLNEG